MTLMSDLSHDLVEEILRRVSITSLGAVRCTCKGWNALSKTRILCKPEARDQFLGFSILGKRIFSMRFNLHGILNEDSKELVDPSINPIGDIYILNQVRMSKVFSCDGLLLCVTWNYNSRLVVWNPYLGQTRLIQPRKRYGMYALGYDNNKNHKILSLFNQERYYEIYDLKSNSWSLFDVDPNWKMHCYEPGVSLNGNTYFLSIEGQVAEEIFFLLCFDFTKERFGKIITLPFWNCFSDTVVLSCVQEEKIAVLYQPDETNIIEIWMTTKIDPIDASWSQFLKVNMKPLTNFDFQFYDNYSFFIDEEKKVAVLFYNKRRTAYIIGENSFLKEVDLEEVVRLPKEVVSNLDYYFVSPRVFSGSYVPSLVQIAGCKSKEEKIETQKEK